LAARKNPSRGGKPDKLMRDALLLELNREARQADGKLTKRLRVVARKLVDCAEQGEVTAIKEIFDRVDGRVPLAQHISGPEGDNPLAEILKLCAASTRGLPDPARVPPDRVIDVTPTQVAPEPQAPSPPPLLPEPPSYDLVLQRRR